MYSPPYVNIINDILQRQETNFPCTLPFTMLINLNYNPSSKVIRYSRIYSDSLSCDLLKGKGPLAIKYHKAVEAH